MTANKKSTLTKNTNAIKKIPFVFAIIVIFLVFIPLSIWLIAFKIPHHANPQHSLPTTQSFTSVTKNGYTFSYPKDWKKSESAGVKGGWVYYLAPTQADPSVKPHVILQVLAATPLTIKRMTQTYVLLKYTKETVTISGTTAQKYTAVLPSENGPFHSIAYEFTNNNKLYLLELGYTQTQTNTKLEQIFSRIVNSFSLK